MIAIALALMLAGQSEVPAAEPLQTETTPAASAYDDEEICRKVTVPSPSSPGGQKRTKMCKTKEEWKEFVKRRT